MSPRNGTGEQATISGAIDVVALTRTIKLGYVVLGLLIALVGAIGGVLAYFGGFARADAVDKNLAAIHAVQENTSKLIGRHDNRISVVETKIDDIRDALSWQNRATYQGLTKRVRGRMMPPPPITTKDEE